MKACNITEMPVTLAGGILNCGGAERSVVTQFEVTWNCLTDAIAMSGAGIVIRLSGASISAAPLAISRSIVTMVRFFD
jgi:hypothetical protein